MHETAKAFKGALCLHENVVKNKTKYPIVSLHEKWFSKIFLKLGRSRTQKQVVYKHKIREITHIISKRMPKKKTI